MVHPFSDMLLRIAQADAYGAGAEYLDRSKYPDVYQKLLAFEGYVAHPTHGRVAGIYTDDTQMSLAIAELILQGVPDATGFTKLQVANNLVKAFQRDPRTGYARRFQKFLESNLAGNGNLFLQNIRPTSSKNGAAVRAVPIGVLPTVGEVIQLGHVNASITHDTPDGHLSSVLVALLSHFAFYTNEPFGRFVPWLYQNHRDVVPREWFAIIHYFFRTPWRESVSRGDGKHSIAWKTMHAVVQLLRRTDCLKQSMLQAIAWGGDVDSVAAIAWGIQSIRCRDSFPAWLEEDLEAGPYGVLYLKDLGAQLMEKYA